MENRAHALAAGLFTLVLTVALIAAVYWIRGEPIAQDSYVLYTRGSVGGLNLQAPVRYRGVYVGKVETIGFDPDDPRIILVTISVQSGTPLTRGAYGQLAAQGVTGLSYVQLNDDGQSPVRRDPSDPNQARIELRPSFFERVSVSGEQVIERMAALTERLDAWLSEGNREQVLRTLSALEGAARSARATTDSLHSSARLVPELLQQAGRTMRNADALMAELQALSRNFGERAQALDRVAASAERIGASAQQLSAAGSVLAAVASRETLPRLNQLLEEVRRSSRSVEQLVNELSANPASLVFGKAPASPGPGESGFEHGVTK
jgi:phospholipid/cholesterol/gamma-HCH transport system substrate-binding protein